MKTVKLLTQATITEPRVMADGMSINVVIRDLVETDTVAIRGEDVHGDTRLIIMSWDALRDLRHQINVALD